MSRNPIRTYRTYDAETMSYREKNDMPSLTVPDMAMSVREVLLRHSQGLPLTRNPNLVYTGDENLPDVRTMDLVEKQQAYEYAQERIQKAMDDIEEKRKERHKKQKERKAAMKEIAQDPDDKKWQSEAAPNNEEAS